MGVFVTLRELEQLLSRMEGLAPASEGVALEQLELPVQSLQVPRQRTDHLMEDLHAGGKRLGKDWTAHAYLVNSDTQTNNANL